MIDDKIIETQNGLLPGKGARGGLFNMYTIYSRYNDAHEDVYSSSIDYEKMSDKVSHVSHIICLQQISATKSIHLTFIINSYWAQNARV